MSDYKELLARLEKKRGFKSINGGEIWELINPNGPEAAKAISQLLLDLDNAKAALRALLACPVISDENYSDPEWGDQETADVIHRSRAAIGQE